MKVAFLAERRSEVSVLGGVLHELRRRGHEIIAVRNGTMAPKAPEDRVMIAQLAAEWPGVWGMRQAPPDALGLASAGTRFVAERTVVVDYCWDMLWQCEGFLTFATARQQQQHTAGVGPIVGSPALAWLAPGEPTDFLFFVPKIRHRRQIPIVWLLAWAARRYTRWRGLRLVGITRRKHGRTGVPFVDTWASIGGALLPSPVQWALQTAAGALHCQSGVQLECVAAGVPAYSVAWPGPAGLTSEVARAVAWKRATWLPGQAWTTVIGALRRGDGPPPAAWNYASQYLGPRDVHARVADYCEERCVS